MPFIVNDHNTIQITASLLEKFQVIAHEAVELMNKENGNNISAENKVEKNQQAENRII